MNEYDIEAEDLNEQMEMVQEINEAISQPIGPVMDDEELEAELAEIEAMATAEVVQKKVMQHKGESMDKVFDTEEEEEEAEDVDAELASLDDMIVPKAKVLMNLSQCPRCV